MQFDQKPEASDLRGIHSGQARIDSSQLGDIPEERIGHRYAAQTNFNLRSPKGVGGRTRSAVLRSMSYGRQAILHCKAADGRPSYAVTSVCAAGAAGSRPSYAARALEDKPLLSCSPSLRLPKEGASVPLHCFSFFSARSRRSASSNMAFSSFPRSS